MADRRVTFIIGANVKNFTKGLKSAQKTFRRFGKDMERMGSTLTRNLTLPLAAIGGSALKASADFETLRQSMDILNGSTEEGARNFERLKRFSAETPFQLQDLAEAQNMLQGFSLSADDAFESMKMIGDIAAVTGGDIKGIGIAFGQAAAEGRLMTRDIRQLINQGVPAIQLLADTMDVATSEVLELASEGEITFAILQQAFREATSEGGMFANGMEKQAQTLGGVFSTMKDNITIALGTVGDSMSGLAKDIMRTVTAAAKAFSSMSEDSRMKMLKIAGLFAASGPVLFAAGKFIVILSSMLGAVRKIFQAMVAIVSSAMGRMAIAFLAGIAIGQRFVDNMTAIFTGNLQDFSLSISGFVDSGIKGIGKMLSPLIDLADKGFGVLTDKITGLVDTQGALEEFYKFFEEATKESAAASQKEAEAIERSTAAINSKAVAMRGFAQASAVMSEGLERATGAFASIREAIRLSEDSLKNIGTNIKTLGLTWERFGKAVETIAGDISQFIANQVSNAFITLGEAIGKSLSGAEDTFATAFEQILLIILDFAKSLARLAAGIGGVMLFIPGLQGIGAGLIAAATALSAITSGISAGINKRIANRQQRAESTPAPSSMPSGSFSPQLSMAGGGSQTIHNQLFLDGQTVWQNQRRVNTNKGR